MYEPSPRFVRNCSGSASDIGADFHQGSVNPPHSLHNRLRCQRTSASRGRNGYGEVLDPGKYIVGVLRASFLVIRCFVCAAKAGASHSRKMRMFSSSVGGCIFSSPGHNLLDFASASPFYQYLSSRVVKTVCGGLTFFNRLQKPAEVIAADQVRITKGNRK